MFWQSEEVTEILRMIEQEHLDIRTVTMGISLRALAKGEIDQTAAAVREHLLRTAEPLVPTIEVAARSVKITGPIGSLAPPSFATRVTVVALGEVRVTVSTSVGLKLESKNTSTSVRAVGPPATVITEVSGTISPNTPSPRNRWRVAGTS